jgi:starch phosphorylase
VIPEFYARDEQRHSHGLGGAMRRSMAQLTPRFSADRTVREYTEQQYLPAAASYRRARTEDKGAFGRQLVDWRRTLESKWPGLRFGDVRSETRGDQRVFED